MIGLVILGAWVLCLVAVGALFERGLRSSRRSPKPPLWMDAPRDRKDGWR